MKFALRGLRLTAACSLLVCLAGSAIAQAPAPGRGQAPPSVQSPQIQSARHVTFRLYAPKAESVRLVCGDMPGVGQGAALIKGDNGVWEVTLGPVDPGAYRYFFNVNGVTTLDPRNPTTSESNNSAWSLVCVPGSDFMDTKNVPHGAVASVTYYSTALSRFRRMHIYTPPGYEQSKIKYPVFYLLHGAGDSDESWTSVGRAGFILDNLIAAKKALPMVVVMPAGHTNPAGGFALPRPGSPAPPDEFTQDFVTDIMPTVEKNYRTLNDSAHRAIAGLSMGGYQTLNIAVPHLDKFAYVGVYSSGLFGIVGQPRPTSDTTPASPSTPFPWEAQHQAELDNARWKQGLKLLWFSTGKDDFLLTTTKATVEMFKKHGFNPVFQESTGGHTWINWHNYLNEFAPQLFR